jgi:hypothetical protein
MQLVEVIVRTIQVEQIQVVQELLTKVMVQMLEMQVQDQLPLLLLMTIMQEELEDLV